MTQRCVGIPQGSILGPLLFLIHTKDIVDDIPVYINLFADHTSLSITVSDPADIGSILQPDTDKVTRWAQRWLVKFKPAKSESLVISRKYFNQTIQVYLCQILKFYQLQATSTWGFFFSNDGSWDIHIKKSIEEA